MNLAVFGATGGTGRHLVSQALDAGHEVTALTRSPEKLSPTPSGLSTVEGDVLVADDVAATVADADAAFCLLGRTPNNPKDVVSRGTENVVAAMERCGVSRLVVLTSMGLGSSRRQVPWYVRLANATVLHELMADKARQEEIVVGSDLDWTVVRPGGLIDGPRTDDYVHGTDPGLRAGPISRADVAAFLLDQLDDDAYVGQTPSVTSGEGVDAAFLYEQITGVAKRLLSS